MNLMEDWAKCWGIPQEALDDLAQRQVISSIEVPKHKADASEAYTQSLIRLAAPAHGLVLHRNNVGVLPNPMGRPVRFGLANDSKAMNESVKSGDLIGWNSVVITPEMVGRRVAIFVSVECKHASWIPGEDPEREKAQQRWANWVNSAGGMACLSTGGLPTW